ncbi:FecR family protein [Pedobacter africanus]|uniref:FecR family protein n=1 Tax=Pedobacter africanus TaxID=151894 RepID=A0A1W2AHE5_9SPHI|nr:FecR family protein [Pedobacter africanus]SMC60097.1 FecR family protein [Pedobacter africanus]
MENEIAKGLIERYANGTCSAEEKAIVESWYLDAMRQADDTDMMPPDFERASVVLGATLPLQRKKSYRYKHIAATAAAICLLAIGAGWYLTRYNHNKANLVLAGKDAEPGKNIAVLRLANGKTISLSDAKKGVVVDAQGLSYNDGSAIQASSTGTAPEGALLKASTPRGGTYQFTLPDGTKVWLNSASSIQFPQAFSGVKERRVLLTGEAYFEVAKMNYKGRRLPFIVESKGQEVEVLGTHFNINSYTDEEEIRTTLLEGSVKVQSGVKTVTITPGQQSRINNYLPGKITVVPGKIEQVMAWKNGYFHFENDNLPTVMRQLSRWYDVDVVYQVSRMDDEFVGDIPRTVRLSDALKVLEYGGGLHFKIENRKLIVTR